MLFSKRFRRYVDRSVFVEFVGLRQILLLCSKVNVYEVGNELGLSKWNKNYHCCFEVPSERVPSQQIECHALLPDGKKRYAFQ